MATEREPIETNPYLALVRRLVEAYGRPALAPPPPPRPLGTPGTPVAPPPVADWAPVTVGGYSPFRRPGDQFDPNTAAPVGSNDRAGQDPAFFAPPQEAQRIAPAQRPGPGIQVYRPGQYVPPTAGNMTGLLNIAGRTPSDLGAGMLPGGRLASTVPGQNPGILGTNGLYTNVDYHDPGNQARPEYQSYLAAQAAAPKTPLDVADQGGAVAQGRDPGQSKDSADADFGGVYDQGGVIREPVVGQGLESGKPYEFVANGRPERVVPNQNHRTFSALRRRIA